VKKQCYREKKHKAYVVKASIHLKNFKNNNNNNKKKCADGEEHT
jgi:hypothetical protein